MGDARRIEQQQAAITRETETLASHNYKSFITTAQYCKDIFQEVCATFFLPFLPSTADPSPP